MKLLSIFHSARHQRYRLIILLVSTISYFPKDWQWDGVVEVPHRPQKRESAFLSVTVGDRSSMNYVLPMVVGHSGYESALEVHLDTITITSSLNDIRLVTAESTRASPVFMFKLID